MTTRNALVSRLFSKGLRFTVAIPFLVVVSGHVVAETRRPNIVLLLADDWGFSDVGAYGSEISTPNIDALAAKGVRFSNFHVAASCSPTRSMLMTGVDNHRNGVGDMPESIPQSHIGKPGYLGVLDTNVVTVASMLRDSGYHTYISGKWHLGKEAHNLPGARGFERSFIQADSGSDNWEDRVYLDIKDKVYWFEQDKTATIPKDFYSSTYYVDKAIQYIQSNQGDDKPFFSYVAFQANHIPLQAPKSFVDKYRGVYKNGWTALRNSRRERAIALGLIPPGAPMVTMSTTTDWDALTPDEKAYQSRRMEVYAGMADAMDHEVGRLVSHLKSTGQYDNTVFVFMSDNGAEASDPYATLSGRLWLDWKYNRDLDRLGSKGAYAVLGPSWGSAAASPLNTYKFYGGEGGLRVPLVISGKGMQQNQISRAFTHVNDIVPTLLAVAGVAPHTGTYQGHPVEPLTGSNLLPLLQGKAQQVHPDEQPIGYELSGSSALFKGDYKLVRVLQGVGDGQWHLYNIQSDPGETKDLQATMPARFDAMRADYDAYAKANQVLDMPADYDPIRQVQINALVNVYVPRFKSYAPAVLAGLSLIACAGWLMRRRRPAA